jgi:hypothetical protein
VDTFLKQLAGIQDSVFDNAQQFTSATSAPVSNSACAMSPSPTAGNSTLNPITSGREFASNASHSTPDLTRLQRPPAGTKGKIPSPRGSMVEQGDLCPEKSSGPITSAGIKRLPGATSILPADASSMLVEQVSTPVDNILTSKLPESLISVISDSSVKKSDASNSSGKLGRYGLMD